MPSPLCVLLPETHRRGLLPPHPSYVTSTRGRLLQAVIRYKFSLGNRSRFLMFFQMMVFCLSLSSAVLPELEVLDRGFKLTTWMKKITYSIPMHAQNKRC